jgi:hypothetical protein
MRKSIIGIAAATVLVLIGILAWNTEATALTGAVPAHLQNTMSLVEKAGCWLPGNCDVGQYQACDHRGRCKCMRCPGWYPWREYKPAH